MSIDDTRGTLSDWMEAHPDLKSVRAALPDLNGCLRGKRVQRDGAMGLDAGLNLPLSASAQDIWGRDVATNPCVLGGDADGRGVWTGRAPLLIDWLAAPTALVLLEMEETGGGPSPICPRQILKRVLGQFRSQGLFPVVATELEFYLVDPEAIRPTVPPSPRTAKCLLAEGVLSIDDLDQFEGFTADLCESAAAAGLKVGAAISEGGVGQFEVNLAHSGDVLAMADDTLLLKILVKGVARRHGLAASFMAKPYADQAGSGMHVHVSVLDEAGVNIFDDGGAEGTAALGHASAGLLSATAGSMLIFAPHLNSYRRIDAGGHAPTRAVWGYDHRLAAVRVPGGPPSARRLEHRIAGADANPYLVLAAVLGALLQGLEAAEPPPPPLSGPLESGPSVTPVWELAIDAFGSGLGDIFDPRFVSLFAEAKRQERARFFARFSDYEYATYLETV
ncbi:MAG: glutamine synthetase family protein [Pseudomonadota bacterium]